MTKNRGFTEEVDLNLALPAVLPTFATAVQSQPATTYTVTASTTGKILVKPAPIANSLGDRVGSKGDTSIVIVGTALTTEVSLAQLMARRTNNTPIIGIHSRDQETDLLTLLAAGEYYVNYETGRILYKNADSSVSVTIAHKYRTPVKVETPPDTGTLANVSASASNQTLLAANAARKGAMIYNDSSATLYVKFGTTASATSYTVLMPANSYYELPYPVYTGIIDGIWSSATGSARVTELT